MILLERGELQLDPTAQMTSPAIRDLQLMFGVMCRVAPKLQDAYWLARNFYNHMIALQIDAKELVCRPTKQMYRFCTEWITRMPNGAGSQIVFIWQYISNQY